MESNASLRKFLDANSRFWDANIVTGGDSGTIFVDIMHDNQWYIRWNLLTAKYLQRLIGGRIIAVQYHWETPLLDYDPKQNAEIAASYGVDKIIDLHERISYIEQYPDQKQIVLIDNFKSKLNELKKLDKQNLRQALLKLEVYDNPDFGWLTYDTFIRSERIATVSKYDEKLEKALLTAFYSLLVVKTITNNENIRAAVLGHIEYLPYAFFGHEAIDREGVCYFLWPLVPGTLRAFRDRESMRQNRDKNFLQFYDSEILSKVSVNSERFELFWRAFRIRFSATRSYKRDNQEQQATLGRRAFLEAYNLNPDVRTVCLLSQALSDAVHANGPMIFQDFGQWIIQTLKMCQGRSDINVLIKVHPRDRTYSRDFFIAEMIRKFDSAHNIAILPRTVENSNIIHNCDCISTVHGTPGYELPLQGISSVIAGQARYSGLGIANEPIDKDSYLNYLLGDDMPPGNLSMQTEQAKTFAFAEFCLFASPSVFVRTDKVRLSSNVPFWNEEAHLVETRNIEDDPFYWSMNDMIENERGHLFRTEFLS